MQLIIETEEEYAPIFRAVAKAVNAKVKKVKKKSGPEDVKGPFIDPGTAKPGEKLSDFFKGAWKSDSTRTAQSIRESAWKRKS